MVEENSTPQEQVVETKEDPVETMMERGRRKLRELQQPLFDSAQFNDNMHPLHGAFGKEL